METKRKQIQSNEEESGNVHPKMNPTRRTGAASDRRKFLNIFQRSSADIRPFVPKFYGSNRQFPRTPVLARKLDIVTRGKFLDYFDIGDQCSARMCAFQQIVTKNGVFRNPAGQRRLERIDVVYSLADEGPLFEQILIDVRDRISIGVQPIGAGERPLEKRPRAPWGEDGVTRGCIIPYPSITRPLA